MAELTEAFPAAMLKTYLLNVFHHNSFDFGNLSFHFGQLADLFGMVHTILHVLF